LFVCDDEKNNQKHCVDFSYTSLKKTDQEGKEIKGGSKNMNRDERTLFNFKKYLNAQNLVNYHDSLFEEE